MSRFTPHIEGTIGRDLRPCQLQVALVLPGESYGRSAVHPANAAGPLVEFRGPTGCIQYYLATLRGIRSGRGLLLDGGPNLSIDAPTLSYVLGYVDGILAALDS